MGSHLSQKYRTQTQPTQDQDMDRVHRRLDEIERVIFALSLFGGSLGVGSQGSGGGQNCGLSINPNTVSLTVPTNDTGSVTAVVTVTSTLAQTVTFAASYIGAAPACLGVPIVTPSTVTFTAGQSIPIAISIPYTNCVTSGLTVHLSLTATTSLGCTTGNLLTGVGTVTTSNLPTFAIEARCNNSSGCCGVYANIWGSVAQNDPSLCNCSASCQAYCGAASDFCPTTCLTCCQSIDFDFRARSINGFAGTITLTCTSPTCSDCKGALHTPCSGIPANVTLTAGQVSTFVTRIGGIFSFMSPTSGTFYAQGTSTMTITGTAASISKQAFVLAGDAYKICP